MKKLILISLVIACSYTAKSQSDNVNTSDYGGTVSLGIDIGGGGLIGIPVRIYLDEKVPLELGVHLRPVLTNDYAGVNIFYSGGFDFYFSKKYIQHKNKVRMNGMFLKGGFSNGERYNETLVSIGWAHERFKVKNKSFTFELGLGLCKTRDKEYVPIRNEYYYDSTDGTSISPMIFWKIGWNFFLGKK